MKWKRTTLTLLLVLFLANHKEAHAECPEDYLDLQGLLGMSQAKGVKELESVHSRLNYHDAATELVWAIKRYELRPDRISEDLVIHSVPSSPVEFWYGYSLTTVKGEGTKALSDLFNRYYYVLPRVVLKRKAGAGKFLALSGIVKGGEMEDAMQDRYCVLYKGDHTLFYRAVASLRPDLRSAMKEYAKSCE